MDTREDFRKSKRVLLNERPLVLLPSLAQAVGVEEAVMIQQLHFHLTNPDNGREHDGEQWIFKTYEDWHKDDFRFWSTRTIRRLFCSLEKKKLVVSCQPEGRGNRRKYYRIDYDRLEKSRARAEAAKSGASMRPKVALPLIRDDSTETTLVRTTLSVNGEHNNENTLSEGNTLPVRATAKEVSVLKVSKKTSKKKVKEEAPAERGFMIHNEFVGAEIANRMYAKDGSLKFTPAVRCADGTIREGAWPK
jgi:hypothetical protein